MWCLANGEVIETKRLSKRELSKKLGLATFEGEIYRSMDTLLEEQRTQVERLKIAGVKNNAGYALPEIKRKDGSFDLTPLIVGSQGTLAIVTEAALNTEPHNPATTLILATFDSLQQLQDCVLELREMSESPALSSWWTATCWNKSRSSTPISLAKPSSRRFLRLCYSRV